MRTLLCPLGTPLTPRPGILTALTQPSPSALRDAIRQTRKLTDKNFGANITLLPSINPPDYEGYARAAVEEGVKVFETAGNNRECARRSDDSPAKCARATQPAP